MLSSPSPKNRPFSLLKWQGGDKRRLLVLSELCGIEIHFLGRSFICGGKYCPACENGLDTIYQGYVAVEFEKRVRLLRLTELPCDIGLRDDHFVPRLWLEVRKSRDRAPLHCIAIGTNSKMEASQIVSSYSLLGVVGRLHGLGSLADGLTHDEAVEALRYSACDALEEALK